MDGADGTRLEGRRSREGTAGTRGGGLVFLRKDQQVRTADAHIHLVASPTISTYAHFHRQPTLEDLRAKLHRRARDAALNATDATLLAVRESEWEAKAR